jgi:hypothetical protein
VSTNVSSDMCTAVRDIKDAWIKVRVNPALDEEAKKAGASTRLCALKLLVSEPLSYSSMSP